MLDQILFGFGGAFEGKASIRCKGISDRKADWGSGIQGAELGPVEFALLSLLPQGPTSISGCWCLRFKPTRLLSGVSCYSHANMRCFVFGVAGFPFGFFGGHTTRRVSQRALRRGIPAAPA